MAKRVAKSKSQNKGAKSKALEPKPPYRPPIDRDEYFDLMAPFLELGYSIWKATLFADIPYRTVKQWFDDDEAFRKKVIREQNKVSAVARLVLKQQIKAGRPGPALTWLERMERDEFGPAADEISSGVTSEGDTIEAIGHDLKGLLANASDDNTEPTEAEGDGDSSDDSQTPSS